ncbi:TIGR03862 family flavoprotein [Acinetobacter sp. MD2]|uniref:TIGR03862 family flavoprotein n=1 Tax=Acinetobacter sp. MD2 TaxID=2600066 RepID=UPI002D1E5B79|nr:TIGR03862 family flavoprotein [Acinetobacter sp. MD2]MEB3767030.1 TIGR03862 family flavoprotein [Acinetobacter sp. MD2]
MPKKVAIVGAGPAGLMAAEVLTAAGHDIHIYEQMPSAARKFLMAGKTGLNISHAEQLEQFIARYDQAEWLAPWIRECDANWIQTWMQSLGIQSYVGTSGRIFPKEMKAAPLLRAWLKRLSEHGVKFHYRHKCVALQGNCLSVQSTQQGTDHAIQRLAFDAIILACGAVSWPKLGSDGAWQNWLNEDSLSPFQASNAGVERTWSDYMQPVFGQPLKRVQAWVNPQHKTHGDAVISHYGLESGVVYKLNRELRMQLNQQQNMTLYVDLLPDMSIADLAKKLQPNKKQSVSNVWRKVGLDAAKACLVRELVDKSLWTQPEQLVKEIKQLKIEFESFRPIEEAISCAGGVKIDALSNQLQLKQNPAVFCCGEMLDWDAPTGGYLLTACFATGRVAGRGVAQYLAEVV